MVVARCKARLFYLASCLRELPNINLLLAMSGARRRGVRLPALDSPPGGNSHRSLTPDLTTDNHTEDDPVCCNLTRGDFDAYPDHALKEIPFASLFCCLWVCRTRVLAQRCLHCVDGHCLWSSFLQNKSSRSSSVRVLSFCSANRH